MQTRFQLYKIEYIYKINHFIILKRNVTLFLANTGFNRELQHTGHFLSENLSSRIVKVRCDQGPFIKFFPSRSSVIKVLSSRSSVIKVLSSRSSVIKILLVLL